MLWLNYIDYTNDYFIVFPRQTCLNTKWVQSHLDKSLFSFSWFTLCTSWWRTKLYMIRIKKKYCNAWLIRWLCSHWCWQWWCRNKSSKVTCFKVFAKSQFELRKQSSHSRQLLNPIPLEHQQIEPVTFDELGWEYTKVLGLDWNSTANSFSYRYHPNPVKFSKRVVLSEIAKIYDSLGLRSPVITDLKRFMKYLWLVDVGWDEPLPGDAAAIWQTYH